MTKLLRISLAAATLFVCVQCSDDDAGATGPKTYQQADAGSMDAAAVSGDALQFLSAYASAVCAMYEPCCEAQALGFDAAGCSTWYRKVTAAYFNGTFRPEPAAACLSELASAQAADDMRCMNVLSFDVATLRDSCRLAFNATDRGGAALRESCTLSADCASDPTGPVICLGKQCLLEKRGSEGDGPCYLNLNGRAEGEATPTQIVNCASSDNLYCDIGSSVCKPLLNDGESCAYNAGCQAGSTCNGGVCVQLPGPGEPCLNAAPGAGGFCRPQSSCDKTSLQCGPALDEGATCREPNECASGSCMSNVCTTPDFTRSLNCTGSNP
jgi:hypothetical protein